MESTPDPDECEAVTSDMKATWVSHGAMSVDLERAGILDRI